jgi:hypothetical protein
VSVENPPRCDFAPGVRSFASSRNQCDWSYFGILLLCLLTGTIGKIWSTMYSGFEYAMLMLVSNWST